MNSAIAIITARGGSKRIPRKNIKDFCGKPILAYSIEAALESQLFDEVMVSTDDMEIADLARSFGAKVPFYRSEKNSNDYAITTDVLYEVIKEYQEMKQDYKWMCCLYPTAPFVTAEKLQKAMRLLKESNNADALFPVARFSYPPQRCFMMSGAFLEYRWPQYKDMRSQDLVPYYHDVGQFYFYKVKNFLMSYRQTALKIIPFIIDSFEMQDIDVLDDWYIAELKYKAMKNKYGGGGM